MLQLRVCEVVIDPAEIFREQVDPRDPDCQSLECSHKPSVAGNLLVLLRLHSVSSTLHHDFVTVGIHPVHLAVAYGVREAIRVHRVDLGGIQPSLHIVCGTLFFTGIGADVRTLRVAGGKRRSGSWLWVRISHLLLHEWDRPTVVKIICDSFDLALRDVTVGGGLVPCSLPGRQHTVIEASCGQNTHVFPSTSPPLDVEQVRARFTSGLYILTWSLPSTSSGMILHSVS